MGFPFVRAKASKFHESQTYISQDFEPIEMLMYWQDDHKLSIIKFQVSLALSQVVLEPMPPFLGLANERNVFRSSALR